MLTSVVADSGAMAESGDEVGVRLMYGENWIHAPSIAKAVKLLARAPVVGSPLPRSGAASSGGT